MLAHHAADRYSVRDRIDGERNRRFANGWGDFPGPAIGRIPIAYAPVFARHDQRLTVTSELNISDNATVPVNVTLKCRVRCQHLCCLVAASDNTERSVVRARDMSKRIRMRPHPPLLSAFRRHDMHLPAQGCPIPCFAAGQPVNGSSMFSGTCPVVLSASHRPLRIAEKYQAGPRHKRIGRTQ